MRQYQYPSEIELERLRAEAKLRRTALAEAGCATFAVGLRGGQPAINCLCCGLGSSNPKDIAEKYCGFCHDWHSNWSEENRAKLP